MENTGQLPKSLVEVIRYFSDPDVCLDYMCHLRWPDNRVVCPTCASAEVRFISTRRIWECKTKHPRRQFSIKIGTIFEDSPIALDKWLATIWMLANSKNGVSSYEIARNIGVTQKTAWFMLQRIRLAIQDDDSSPFSDQIEANETRVAAKARNIYAGRVRPEGGQTTL